ncbi:apolipoprotein N-acyltransferase [Chamaesiphon sp. VAR_48_metabat_135_sub]|uniref:apolipoprotein N-acyltransferase n=1 Tax=Chamaesiphon sp. VAR_48_metabat_135_sub TaxID=2964699 RepID=UPI00286B398C|nr:apolipoprotein N-acyltransferase [Chamaesiphon sp. VAR_48_metabat_135_sub]
MLLSFRKSLTKLTDNLFELGLALGSGILMGITLAPLEAWYFAWIALAPLWYLVCRDRHSPAVLYGLCWGIGFYGLGLSWIFGIHPMTWMGVPYLASLGIATFCLTFITLWGTSLAILWSICLKFINYKPQLNPSIRVILGTACWCGLEELYSLTDLWWTSLALTQSPHNLAILHLGQLSGPTTVTGSIVLINGLIAEAYLAFSRNRHQLKLMKRIRPAIPYISTAIASIIILHLIGSNLADRPLIQSIESSLKIGIIQGNIGNEVRHYRSGYDLAIDNYTKGYLELAEQSVAAVVTPETAFPYRESQIKRTPFYQAILAKKVTALIGGFGEVPSGITNSILTINGKGETISRYDKWKLVPLGEYIPFEQYLGKLIDTISPLDSHLAAGKFAPSVITPFGNTIFGICYDSAYHEHFRRQAQTGDLIITAANDAHYGSAMPAQHHALDLMRAIETDRWAVRASNTGYSAVIDPHGQTQWISKLDEFAAHAHQVYRRHTQTLYVRVGNWLTPLLFAIGLILFFRSYSSIKSEV